MKKIAIVVVVVTLMATLLLSSAIAGRIIDPGPTYVTVTKSLSPMINYHGHGTGEHDSTCANGACGPSAGVSIGWYYKNRNPATYGCNYINLSPTRDEMYDVLYEEIPSFWCYTDPFYYGYGFVEMTIDPDQDNNTDDGYYNFGYVYDDDVTAGDYSKIVDAINHGWPVALDGNFRLVGYVSKSGPGPWPPQVGHWIAIKGYKYKYETSSGEYVYRRIICTDSYSQSDELVFDWYEVINDGYGLVMNIIKDKIPEDFEWGNSGDSLSTDGGTVDWTVSAGGSSYAQISSTKHSGTRGARFYRDGTNNVQASYSEVQPIWRGFWLRKNSTAVFYTRTGDGSHSILVRVLDSGSNYKLQYYYNGVWRDAGCSLTSSTKWYFIEFRAIHWDGPYNYDYAIYVDGNYVKGGVPMCTEPAYEGITAYYSDSGSGSFWIDDIPSSWW